MTKKTKHHDNPDPVFDDTGPSSSQTPYLVPAHAGVQIESLLSVGDQVGVKEAPAELAGQPWRMVGIPDGLGAFDNGDGTMTVLMNHELGQTLGAVREHGSTGAFVSELTIDMTTHEVLDAKDLSEDVFLFNRTTNAYEETTTQFGRLCSADLPAVSAFYDAATGLGTTERIFMDGEEIGNEGRAFAHIVTGAEAGDSYELPALGRMSWENSVANAYSGAKTVVMCDDDSTPGEVYVYIGDKQATGNAVEKAGLTNGALFGISASFGDDTGPGALNGTFQLIAQGNAGDVTHTTGTELQAQSGPLTQFGRPEDGAWDPSNPDRYYFITTGTPTQPTRLWAMDYYDIEHPELGGTIKVLVEGVFSNSDPNSALPLMLDNLTVTESGLVIMQEDPGNNPRLAKVWMYDPHADNGVDPLGGLTELAHHDPARFTAGLDTPAPGGTFNSDEESSGVVDVTSLLGNGEKLAFLLDTQAHYTNSFPELVEGGQLMAMYVDLPNPGDSKFDGGNGNDTGSATTRSVAAEVTTSCSAITATTRSTAATATTLSVADPATMTSPAGTATTRSTAAPATMSSKAGRGTMLLSAASAMIVSLAVTAATPSLAVSETTSSKAVRTPTRSMAVRVATSSWVATAPTPCTAAAATTASMAAPVAISSMAVRVTMFSKAALAPTRSSSPRRSTAPT